MNLKLLISLKFIATILFLGTIGFCYYKTNTYDEALERANTIYEQQNKFYDLEKAMAADDTQGLAKLHELREENRLEIKKQTNITDSISLNFYTMILFASLIAGGIVVLSLDNKIEQKKRAMNDKEEIL